MSCVLNRCLAMILFVVLLPLFQARADVRSWKAATTGDWFDSANWVEGVVPITGDDVFITNLNASALLTASTPVLASLTVSRTLTATNWDTVISADTVSILAGGTITTPAVSTNSSATNRVHIVCQDFILETGGQINVDAKGYGGGWAGNGNSSSTMAGQGPGASGTFGAAGYGGRGGDADTATSLVRGGGVYGGAAAPTGPGSGGGSTDGRTGRAGGHGGGAVRIEASGHVLVNGIITAVGGPNGVNGGSGPGSGGAIWITCQTFAGTNGTIRANGRNGVTGSGGGRIALAYDPVAQDDMPLPSVVFSTLGGTMNTPTTLSQNGDLGSLHFTDNRFARSPIPHSGQLSFTDPTGAYAFDDLVVSNGWIRFPDGLADLAVSNDLTVFGPTGRLDIGGSRYYTAAGFWRLLNRGEQVTTLAVGGNLTVTNGASLVLVSAATNALSITNGLLVLVDGDVTVAPNSWISFASNPTNGGAPLLACRNLDIRPGGGIEAFQSGFAGGRNARGFGPGGVARGGGGHGGRGGAYNATYGGGPVNGSAEEPTHPGSGGGSGDSRTTMAGGFGGGNVRLVVSDHARIDGTLTANGGRRGNNYSSGGSGGAVFVDCRLFTGAETALFSAQGGSGGPFGGGGGGRIAVRFGDRPDFAGAFSVDGGDGVYQYGSNGTVALVDRGPVITNLPAEGIAFSQAWSVGDLLATGDAPAAVTVYWGPADGGTDPHAWAGHESLSPADAGLVSNLLTGLDPQSTYYYRYFATNAFGSKWAPETTAFSTLGGPTVDNGVGPTEVGRTAATLNGDVLTGSPTPLTLLCWGDTDGETLLENWDFIVDMGDVLGPFSTTVSNLLANKTYYYRAYVTNSFGQCWSPATTNFTTLPPALSIADIELIEGPAATVTDAVFTVSLSDLSAIPVSVDFASADLTATAGSDYTATNGTLVIPAGQFSGSVRVEVLGDDLDEYPFEQFSLILSNPLGAVLDRDSAVATVWDDDDIPETKIWTGVADWTSPANWSPAGLPSPSDEVLIESGAATLSENAMIPSPVFGGADRVRIRALAVSNAATLVFTNWSTFLAVEGDVRIFSNALVTTPPTVLRGTATNRVHFACSNLYLEAGGRIDVDAKGYGGGWAANSDPYSSSTGRGPGGGTTGPGSYGGRGGSSGDGSYYFPAGSPYGVASAPTGPGSGGGSTDGRTGREGGHGGGAVRIIAAEHVLLDGALSANGGPQGIYGSSSPGSGGAIWITCRTVGGTNGLVHANGLDGQRGGGGGRIALSYDPAAQALLPGAEVLFSARGGTSSASSDQGDIGTLHFTDSALLRADPVPHTGQLVIPDHTQAIAFEDLRVSGWIRFAAGDYALTVSNALTVLGPDGRLDVGGNTYSTLAAERWVYNAAAAAPALSVGTELLLTNGGRLVLYAGVTNELVGPYGAFLNVGGDLAIASNSWLSLSCNPTNGGSPLIDCRNLLIPEAGGGIEATGSGFAGGWNGTGRGPGGSTQRGGGGFGGRGGGYNAALPARGPVYGDEREPVQPGSGGGSTDGRSTYNGGHGGGLVRIHAAGQVLVNGTLSANGRPHATSFAGPGSGGGIYIRCNRFAGGPTGLIQARGGNQTFADAGGGGGGGRIAVRRVPSRDTYTGAFDVAGGLAFYQNGEEGTVFLDEIPFAGGALIIIR